MFCKVIGWKNIIYLNKNDPYLFLKMGGEIKEIVENTVSKNYNQFNSIETEGSERKSLKIGQD